MYGRADSIPACAGRCHQWRLVVAKIVCICLFASCKPLVRQEPVSSDKILGLKGLWRMITNNLANKKATVQLLISNMAVHKTYKSLVKSIIDVHAEVYEIKIKYRESLKKNLDKLVLDTGMAAKRYNISTIREKALADYKQWSTRLVSAIDKSLRTNPIYRTDTPNMQLGLSGGGVLNEQPRNMGELVEQVQLLIKFIQTPPPLWDLRKPRTITP